MKVKEIRSLLEQAAPEAYAMGWDNSGLILGRTDKEVKKILITVDVDDNTVDQALLQGADLVLSHHPLVFQAVKRITDEEFIGRRIGKLLRADVAYEAMHTNYDVLGMADLVANTLGLQETEVLDITWEKDGHPEGIGRIGRVPCRTTLEECCRYVKKQLHLEHVKVFGDPEKEICCMAVSPGSGKSAVDPAVSKAADVLVTGDIGHHEGLDALEQNLAVIDAGHYGTEYFFIRDMERFLKRELGGNELEVLTEESGVPFRIV